MIQKSTLLFALCMVLFSCSSESTDNTNEPTNDSTLLKKTIETDSDGEKLTTNYTYDGNKLTNVIYDDGSKNTYTYENDKLIREDQFLEGELAAYITLEYNADKKVASFTEFWLEPSGIEGLVYKHVLTYNNDNTITNKVYRGDINSQTDLSVTQTITLDGKNITEIKDDNAGEYKLLYSYDNSNGIFKNIHAIEVLNLLSQNEFGAYINGNSNNVTSFIESSTSPNEFNKETFEYTYNNSGYPIAAKSYFDGELDGSIEYFYE
ncbi:hypothetical protein [Flavivirga spongiicola]|uniref:YD repeat-containing protein n=1 Tax=Flavivirga spongiicola TaxID=421621 RepID=A0ABU7XY60_9FLAO|nr:hypothetical protein [Flavivirga sp. MEBiC05379]MDO5980712.1 hypothetical protein [Flavivirga sp. MEBiC05379]